jgi:hypothetical protein
MVELARHTTRVNIKSLAAEAKIIRQEVEKTKSLRHKANLNEHRRGRLRYESRLAHLVLCYLMGKKRSECEPTRREDPYNFQNDFTKKLKRMVPWSYEIIYNLDKKQKEIFDWLKS